MKKIICAVLLFLIAPTYSFAAQVMFESRIVNEFNGFDSDAIFIMSNGTAWKQYNYLYKYSYKYNPQATIIRQGPSKFFLFVDGIEEYVEVEYLGEAYEESIVGEFDGWDGDTIFKLSDGSIWEQVDSTHEHNHQNSPDIYLIEYAFLREQNIFLYYALVEDSDELVHVRRIK